MEAGCFHIITYNSKNRKCDAYIKHNITKEESDIIIYFKTSCIK